MAGKTPRQRRPAEADPVVEAQIPQRRNSRRGTTARLTLLRQIAKPRLLLLEEIERHRRGRAPRLEATASLSPALQRDRATTGL